MEKYEMLKGLKVKVMKIVDRYIDIYILRWKNVKE